MSKQAVSYNRALQEIIRAVNSQRTPGEKLQILVKAAAGALGVRGCSLLLLDAQKKRFFHAAHHGLTDRYVKKGYLKAEKYLLEVMEGKPSSVLDVESDPGTQYKSLAKQENIVSMLTVPVLIREEIVGILRVYSRIRREFLEDEQQFLRTVANLAALILDSDSSGREDIAGPAQEKGAPSLTSQIRPAAFAHPSEEEFAHLLDFYQIDWMYEPRSFTLDWDGRPSEVFTPDFYLPTLDLYIEITTLKSGLMREKKRKVKRLRELHPDINIKLLARQDYDRLLAKYGHGPLSGPKTHGVGRVLLAENQIQKRVSELAFEISRDYQGKRPVLIGVLRGVFCFMADFMRYITVPVDLDFMALSYYRGGDGKAVRVTMDVGIDLEGRDVILVEDIVDTGMTLSFVLGYLKSRNPASLKVCTLLDKKVRRLADVALDYVGFEVPDEFLVGYGLDYQEEYRNLPFIALMEEEGNILPEAQKNLG